MGNRLIDSIQTTPMETQAQNVIEPEATIIPGEHRIHHLHRILNWHRRLRNQMKDPPPTQDLELAQEAQKLDEGAEQEQPSKPTYLSARLSRIAEYSKAKLEKGSKIDRSSDTSFRPKNTSKQRAAGRVEVCFDHCFGATVA
ncbi:hypothetical protein CCACVL1_24252 [Corchorus capsularis]|uniref:Uncharacterized protein n=1 Tax=Corchorus capsularis TaxID=210143 RepID=A0A1R3GQG5_COCAP|nr:hypothetical protein CCACVL1_24252 [Corchorus capsularis]